MAKLPVHLPNYTFLFLSFLFLLLVYSGTQMVEAQLCERRSGTLPGLCPSRLLCDRRCRELEGAVNGECIRQSLFGFACFCYHRC